MHVTTRVSISGLSARFPILSFPSNSSVCYPEKLVTTHIGLHRSIRISVTSNFFSCALFAVHVSILTSVGPPGLTVVLYTFIRSSRSLLCETTLNNNNNNNSLLVLPTALLTNYPTSTNVYLCYLNAFTPFTSVSTATEMLQSKSN